jgi:transmembrane sensor
MTPSLPPPEDAARLRQDVLEWFVRRNREEWRAADEREFQAWLVADARHREAYRQWETRWAALDAISPETVATWRSGFAGNQAAPTRRGFLKPAFAMAAAGMAVGGGYLGWRQLQAQPVFEQAFATARGQQLDVPLPDGSRLRLDTATRVEIRLFRDRREVTLLDGQVVFAVQSEKDEQAKDSGRPFDVLAGPLRVRVVGTRFAVRYTPGIAGAEGARVSVEEGRVHVMRKEAEKDAERDAEKKGVFLTAGQQVESDALGALAAVASVPGEGIAPWREHRLSFVDTPLSRALAELERYGNTGLVVKDPLVAALRLSGTFDPRDARTLRRALPSALPVRLKDAGRVAEIVSAH